MFIMNITLGSLKTGQWRELTRNEVKGLLHETDAPRTVLKLQR